jgi:hypothetical protein
MKRKTLLLGAAVGALILGAPPAMAGKTWYVGFEAGASLVDDIDGVRTIGSYGPTDITVHVDNGWALFATVGYWVAEIPYRGRDRLSPQRTSRRPVVALRHA